nr:hypothetical protein [Lactiplantibacillus plantarum]
MVLTSNIAIQRICSKAWIVIQIPCIINQVEKLRRWLFPIGGGAYGVKPLKPINPNERSSLSVRCGRFTINADFRYLYRGLNCLDYLPQ